MNPRPAFHWFTEAVTVFLNGCISGLGGGAIVGAGTGAAAISPIGEGITSDHKLLATAGAILLSALGNGAKRLVVWHDSNPLPNPFLDEPATPPLPPTDPTATFEKL